MAVYTVPPTYGGGVTDHGQNIIDFIKSVPDGTPLNRNRIVFSLNGDFRSEKKILLTLRNYLDIDLNGARIKNTVVAPYSADGSGFYPGTRADLVKGLNRGRSVFELDKCTNVRITSTVAGGTLQGAGPSAPSYNANFEAQNGVNITGGDTIEIDHVTITNVYGDWVQSNRSDTTVVGGQKMPDNIWIHDCVMRYCSRQGITDAASLSSYLVENNDIANGARHCIDLENDDPHGTIPIVGFTFRANKVGHFNLGFVACAGNSQVVQDITIGGLTQADGNTLVGQTMDMIMQSSPVWKVDASNNFILDGNGDKIPVSPKQYWRNQNLLVGWNTSDTEYSQATGGAVKGMILAQGWDGVTVIDNNARLRPTTGDQGVVVDNCTGYQGNIHNNLFTGAANEWAAINPFTTPPPPPPTTGWDAGKWDDGTWDDSSVVAPNSTPPGAPRTVVATAGDGNALVTWVAPTSDGGQPITSWIVTPYLGTTAHPSVTVPVGPLLATVTVANGSTWTFTVRAVNSVGTGTESAHSAAVTPVAPATVPGAPTITSVVGADSFVGVVWNPPASNGGAPVTAYVVRLYIGAAAQAPQFVAAPQTFVFAPAVNGTAYTATVQAVNAVGNSAESAHSGSVTPTAAGTGGGSAPDTPTGVTAQPGDGNAIVYWAFPFDGGSVITGYTVTPYIAGVAQTPFPVSGSFPATTVTGLTNGTAYTFKVTATNVNGTSAQSAASAPVTPVAAVTVTAPAVPTNLRVTGGDGQAVLQWDVPANGGDPIVSYTITSYVDADVVDTDLIPVGLPFIFLLLTNDVTYRFTVIATNSTGSSAESAFSPAVTPQAEIITPPPPPPPTPTDRGWTFRPPTELVVGPVAEDAMPLSNRLMRHYGMRPRGRTIWELIDGTFTFDQPYPTIEDTGANRASLHLVPEDGQWSNLTSVTYRRVFLGGHEYFFDADQGPFIDRLVSFLTDQGYNWQDWIEQESLAWILTSQGNRLGGIGGIVFVRRTGG